MADRTVASGMEPGTNRFRDKFSGQGLSERHLGIAEAAATLFAERGYAATSVRDIGEKVGLLGGSLYHYIKSKEALFILIHDLALEMAEEKIRLAIRDIADPWQALEAAAVAMLEIQLDPDSLTMPLMNDFTLVPPDVRSKLVAKRDAFEDLFRDMVARLPLSAETDPRVFRLSLLTLLNNVSTWYRPDGLSPAEIGHQIITIFRQGGHDRREREGS